MKIYFCLPRVCRTQSPSELRENGNRYQQECWGGSINEAKVRVRQGTASKGGNWIVIQAFRTSDSQHSENSIIREGTGRARTEVILLICVQIAYLTFSCFRK